MAASQLLIYGARSGIQKSIRRGEPSLTKTCFDIICSDPKHEQWLSWRLPVLVFEDCWPLLGDLALMQSIAKGKSKAEKRDLMFRFLIKLAISTKNQDAAWLWFIAAHGKREYEHVEFRAMREIAKFIFDDKPADLPYETVLEILSKYTTRNLTEYEKNACLVAEGRRKSGGMASDQWNALAAVVLIHLRGIEEMCIESMVAEQKKVFSGEKITFLNELPLCCFDMHTRPGLLAMKVWLKNHKTSLLCDNEHLATSWFQLESAKLGDRVKPEFVDYSDQASPTTIQSMWEQAKLEAIANWYGVSVNEMIAHWDEQKGKVFELVRWALTKQ